MLGRQRSHASQFSETRSGCVLTSWSCSQFLRIAAHGVVRTRCPGRCPTAAEDRGSSRVSIGRTLCRSNKMWW